jgi:hypothetical protein
LFDLIKKIKRDNNLDVIENTGNTDLQKEDIVIYFDELEEIIDSDLNTAEFDEGIDSFYEIYCQIISAYKTLYDNELIEEDLKYLKSLQVGTVNKPSSVIESNEKEHFLEWIKKRKGYTHV